ncbi:MAG TPA: hypothetical protein VHB98_03045 [Chloroflexota bacterium]|nr:hypothetical protein [Chloroflexota bacterium]
MLMLLAGTVLTLRLTAGPWPAPTVAAAPGQDAGARIVAIAATPARVMVLDRVTLSAVLINDGHDTGPYQAVLWLVPQHGRALQPVAQSGFHLRHHQRLTLYWEWRAGTSLPPDTYHVLVQLRDPGNAARPFAALEWSRQLIVLSI